MTPSERNVDRLNHLMQIMAQNHRAMADLLEDMRRDIRQEPKLQNEAFMAATTLDEMALQQFKIAYYRNKGNRKKISTELGISERTVYRYMKKWKAQDNDEIPWK